MSVRIAEPLDEPIVVSPRRAQQMLDIGHSRLYELLSQGELQSYKDGRSRKIVVASIKEYVARKLEVTSHTGQPA
jgi:excisionase family DNA binding protein